jgi:hypothetical protein
MDVAEKTDEVITPEQAMAAQAEESQAFDQEFVPPTEPPPPAAPEPKDEDAPPAEAAAPIAEPKFVQVTEDDLATLRQTATSLTEIKAAMDKGLGTVFGKMGSLEQTLRGLQEQTPFGQGLVLTEKHLAELKEDFPDLTANMIKGLNRALGTLKGTGGAPNGALTPETINKLITDAVTASEQRIEDTLLTKQVAGKHKDWLDTINGPVGPDGFRHGVDAEGKPTAYRQWLAKQPAEYQQTISETRDPQAVIASIDDFKKAPAGSPGSSRSTRLKEAVPPKGSAGAVPTGQTEDDGFQAGLKIGAS